MQCLGPLSALAKGQIQNAIFTESPIKIDGYAESPWNRAPAANIAICMNAELTAQLTGCKVSGMVQALWNGPHPYLLITVTDSEFSTSEAADSKRSGVRIHADQCDDKFPKLEEDDGNLIIGVDGPQNGNPTLAWNAVAGRLYQLQRVSDLRSNNWINLGSPILATNATVTTSDVLGTDSQRFYRLLISGP